MIDAKNVTEPVSLKREQVCCTATGHVSFPTNRFVTLNKVFCASSVDQIHMIMDGEMGRLCKAVAYPGILFGGVSTNSVEDRENGDLGAVAP